MCSIKHLIDFSVALLDKYTQNFCLIMLPENRVKQNNNGKQKFRMGNLHFFEQCKLFLWEIASVLLCVNQFHAVSAVVWAVAASTCASVASRRAASVALSAASKCVLRVVSAANALSRSRSNSVAILGILVDG